MRCVETQSKLLVVHWHHKEAIVCTALHYTSNRRYFPRVVAGLFFDTVSTETATYTTRTNKKKKIHALSKIRARDTSNQPAVDIRLRPNGHRDQFPIKYPSITSPSDTI